MEPATGLLSLSGRSPDRARGLVRSGGSNLRNTTSWPEYVVRRSHRKWITDWALDVRKSRARPPSNVPRGFQTNSAGDASSGLQDVYRYRRKAKRRTGRSQRNWSPVWLAKHEAKLVGPSEINPNQPSGPALSSKMSGPSTRRRDRSSGPHTRREAPCRCQPHPQPRIYRRVRVRFGEPAERPDVTRPDELDALRRAFGHLCGEGTPRGGGEGSISQRSSAVRSVRQSQ